jgi:hypothetical protein
MGQCAAQVFTGVSPEKFACVQAKAAAQGITISGNQGSASKDGITVTWDFEGDSQTLTIQCTAAPFFVSCGTINSTIHNFVDSCS